MSDHTTAIVPIETWAYSSPELRYRGRSVDIGLLAESLIYYDRVLLNVSNQPQFAEVIQWFTKQGRYKNLLSLLREDTLQFYDYSFASAAVLTNGVYVLLNIQDELQAKPNTFEQRFLYHPAVQACFENRGQRKALYLAMRGRVFEAKASDFGSALENAREDHKDPERNSLALQAFVDELYSFRQLGKTPRIQASVTSAQEGSTHTISWGANLENLARFAGPNLNFNEGTPLTAGAICNRLITSAHQLGCDLYLARPMGVLAGDKLYESAYSVYKSQDIIQQLMAEVEFPDIRRLVNENHLNLEDILSIRAKSAKFRKWLQTEGERDRNAIIAYHNETAKELGIVSASRKTLEFFGIVGGAAIGASLGASTPGPFSAVAGAVAGGAFSYLLGVGSKIGVDWKPVVFGNWMSERIKKLLASRANKN